MGFNHHLMASPQKTSIRHRCPPALVQAALLRLEQPKSLSFTVKFTSTKMLASVKRCEKLAPVSKNFGIWNWMSHSVFHDEHWMGSMLGSMTVDEILILIHKSLLFGWRDQAWDQTPAKIPVDPTGQAGNENWLLRIGWTHVNIIFLSLQSRSVQNKNDLEYQTMHEVCESGTPNTPPELQNWAPEHPWCHGAPLVDCGCVGNSTPGHGAGGFCW